jgi:hypothetical protein
MMMIRTLSLTSVGFVFVIACSAGSGTPSGSSSGASGARSTGVGGAASGGGAGLSSGGSAGLSGGPSGGAAGSVGSGGSATGAAGSGGLSASAGNTGSSGAAGSSTTGCAGMPLCDDFEATADTAGATPAGWTLFKPGGCSGSAQYSATIDTSQFHSGTRSVKVSGGDSCGPLLVNTSGLAAITGGEVYGRFFVRMPSTTAFDHAVMMALGLAAGADTTSFDQATNLQLAPEEIGTSSALVWQTTDGNILPAKAPAAAPTTTFPMANTWTCVEFHVSANTSAIETWIDGNAISGLTFIPGTTTKVAGVNDQWTPAPLTPTTFALGWIVFSAPSISLWFDDAALNTKRIGCN